MSNLNSEGNWTLYGNYLSSYGATNLVLKSSDVSNGLVAIDARAFGLPVGASNERPTTTRPGMLRYSNETNGLEFYNGSLNEWQEVGNTETTALLSASVSDICGELIILNTNVGTNSGLITALQTHTDASLASLGSSITTNTSNISSNSGLITALQTHTDASLASLDTDIATNTSNISSNTGLITALQTHADVSLASLDTKIEANVISTAEKVPLAGGTMTGNLTVPNVYSNNLDTSSVLVGNAESNITISKVGDDLIRILQNNAGDGILIDAIRQGGLYPGMLIQGNSAELYAFNSVALKCFDGNETGVITIEPKVNDPAITATPSQVLISKQQVINTTEGVRLNQSGEPTDSSYTIYRQNDDLYWSGQQIATEPKVSKTGDQLTGKLVWTSDAPSTRLALLNNSNWDSGDEYAISAIDDNDDKSLKFSYSDGSWLQDNEKVRLIVAGNERLVSNSTGVELKGTLTNNGSSVALQSSVDTNSTEISNLASRVDNSLVSLDDTKVNRSGDTITGILNLGGGLQISQEDFGTRIFQSTMDTRLRIDANRQGGNFPVLELDQNRARLSSFDDTTLQCADSNGNLSFKVSNDVVSALNQSRAIFYKDISGTVDGINITKLKSEYDSSFARVDSSLNTVFSDLNQFKEATDASFVYAELTYAPKIAPLFTSGIDVSGGMDVSGNSNIDGSLLVTGTVTVSGNILPAQDIFYDIGSANYRFRDLYLSGDTIKLGDTTISTAGSGSISIGDASGNTRTIVHHDEFEPSFNQLIDNIDENKQATDASFVSISTTIDENKQATDASFVSVYSKISTTNTVVSSNKQAADASFVNISTTIDENKQAADASFVNIYSKINATNTVVSSNRQAADASFVDLETRKLNLSGGTMTGSLNMGSNKVTSSYVPQLQLDLANKKYVDDKVSALVDSAPEALDTLKELATAITDTCNNTIVSIVNNIGANTTSISNLENHVDISLDRLDADVTSLENTTLKNSGNQSIQDGSFTVSNVGSLTNSNEIRVLAGESGQSKIMLGTIYTLNASDTDKKQNAAIIAEGTGSYGKSDLHLCVADPIESNDSQYSASTSDARLTVTSDGKVNAYQNLQVNGKNVVDSNDYLSFNGTQLAKKSEVDNSISSLNNSKVNKTGDTFTGNVLLSNSILNIENPANSNLTLRKGTVGESFSGFIQCSEALTIKPDSNLTLDSTNGIVNINKRLDLPNTNNSSRAILRMENDNYFYLDVGFSNLISGTNGVINFNSSIGNYFNSPLIFSGDVNDVFIKRGGSSNKSLVIQAGDNNSSTNDDFALLFNVRNSSGNTYTALQIKGKEENIEVNRDFKIGDSRGLELAGSTAPSVTANKLYRSGSELYWNGSPLVVGTGSIDGKVSKSGDSLTGQLIWTSDAPATRLALVNSENWDENDVYAISAINTADDKALKFSFSDGTWLQDNNQVRLLVDGNERVVANQSGVELKGSVSSNGSAIALQANVDDLQTHVDLSLVSLSDDIANNASNVSNNASSISTNASNISTNASNISTNTSNISTNSGLISALQTHVDISMANLSDGFVSNSSLIDSLQTHVDVSLAGLSDDIVSNTSLTNALQTHVDASLVNLSDDVVTNTSNISANTTNISANSGLISALQSHVDVSLASLSDDIVSNASLTNALQTHIDLSLSSLSDNIAANASDVSTNASNISTNTTNISTNSGLISALQSHVDVSLTSLSDDIVSNTGLINDLQTHVDLSLSSLSDDIAANASDVSTNASNISNNATNISTNSGLISALQSHVDVSLTSLSDDIVNNTSLTNSLQAHVDASLASVEGQITSLNANKLGTTGDQSIQEGSLTISNVSPLSDSNEFRVLAGEAGKAKIMLGTIYADNASDLDKKVNSAIIAEGVNSYGKSNLHFCVSDPVASNDSQFNADVSSARLTITSDGKVDTYQNLQVNAKNLIDDSNYLSFNGSQLAKKSEVDSSVQSLQTNKVNKSGDTFTGNVNISFAEMDILGANNSSFKFRKGDGTELFAGFLECSDGITIAPDNDLILAPKNNSKVRVQPSIVYTSPDGTKTAEMSMGDNQYVRITAGDSEVFSAAPGVVNFPASIGAYFSSRLVFSGDANDVFISRSGSGGKSLLLQAGDNNSSTSDDFAMIFKVRNSSAGEYTALEIKGKDEKIEVNRDFKIADGRGIELFGSTAPSVTTNKLYRSGNDLYWNGSVVGSDPAAKLDLAGGTMSGSIDMGGNKVTSTYVPVSDADLTNKLYVDGKVSSLVDSAPEYLNTLGELATAIRDTCDNVITDLLTSVGTNSTAINTIKGSGWVDQTIKGNADAISTKLSLSGGTMTGDLLFDINTYKAKITSYVGGWQLFVDDGQGGSFNEKFRIGNDWFNVFSPINCEDHVLFQNDGNGIYWSGGTKKLGYNSGTDKLEWDGSEIALASSVSSNASDITTIKGSGWTDETIKGNADAIATKLDISGGTMTGDLTVPNINVSSSLSVGDNDSKVTFSKYDDSIVRLLQINAGDGLLIDAQRNGGDFPGLLLQDNSASLYAFGSVNLLCTDPAGQGTISLSPVLNGKPVLTASSTGVSISGELTVDGDISLGGNKITTTYAPVSDEDLTNKLYVNEQTNNLRIHVDSSLVSLTDDIATNVSNISSNASSISTNASNISTNSGLISGLQTHVDSSLASLSDDIVSNTSAIDTKVSKSGDSLTGQLVWTSDAPATRLALVNGENWDGNDVYAISAINTSDSKALKFSFFDGTWLQDNNQVRLLVDGNERVVANQSGVELKGSGDITIDSTSGKFVVNTDASMNNSVSTGSATINGALSLNSTDGLELALSGTPSSPTNKLYQVGNSLHYNGKSIVDVSNLEYELYLTTTDVNKEFSSDIDVLTQNIGKSYWNHTSFTNVNGDGWYQIKTNFTFPNVFTLFWDATYDNTDGYHGLLYARANSNIEYFIQQNKEAYTDPDYPGRFAAVVPNKEQLAWATFGSSYYFSSALTGAGRYRCVAVFTITANSGSVTTYLSKDGAQIESLTNAFTPGVNFDSTTVKATINSLTWGVQAPTANNTACCNPATGFTLNTVGYWTNTTSDNHRDLLLTGEYEENLASQTLHKSGGTMTGNISLGSNKITTTVDPSNVDELARKGYVDTKLPLDGGTMTGNISLGSNKITTTVDPSNVDELARKGYVDTKLSLDGGTMTGQLIVDRKFIPDVPNVIIKEYDAASSKLFRVENSFYIQTQEADSWLEINTLISPHRLEISTGETLFINNDAAFEKGSIRLYQDTYVNGGKAIYFDGTTPPSSTLDAIYSSGSDFFFSGTNITGTISTLDAGKLPKSLSQNETILTNGNYLFVHSNSTSNTLRGLQLLGPGGFLKHRIICSSPWPLRGDDNPAFSIEGTDSNFSYNSVRFLLAKPGNPGGQPISATNRYQIDTGGDQFWYDGDGSQRMRLDNEGLSVSKLISGDISSNSDILVSSNNLSIANPSSYGVSMQLRQKDKKFQFGVDHPNNTSIQNPFLNCFSDNGTENFWIRYQSVDKMWINSQEAGAYRFRIGNETYNGGTPNPDDSPIDGGAAPLKVGGDGGGGTYINDHVKLVYSTSGGPAEEEGSFVVVDYDDNFNASILAEYDIATQGTVRAVSDSRVKRDIRDASENEALDLFRQIPMHRYKYKDVLVKGTAEVYGVIAQEVEEVAPWIVRKQAEHLPSIMVDASVQIIQLTENFDASYAVPVKTLSEPVYDQSGLLLEQHDITNYYEFKVLGSYDLSLNDNLKLLDISDNVYYCNVTRIDSDGFCVDVAIKEIMFVYGQYVTDRRLISKDQYFMVAAGAVADIDRKQQELITKNQALDTQNQELAARVESLESHVATLTQALITAGLLPSTN